MGDGRVGPFPAQAAGATVRLVSLPPRSEAPLMRMPGQQQQQQQPQPQQQQFIGHNVVIRPTAPQMGQHYVILPTGAGGQIIARPTVTAAAALQPRSPVVAGGAVPAQFQAARPMLTRPQQQQAAIAVGQQQQQQQQGQPVDDSIKRCSNFLSVLQRLSRENSADESRPRRVTQLIQEVIEERISVPSFVDQLKAALGSQTNSDQLLTFLDQHLPNYRRAFRLGQVHIEGVQSSLQPQQQKQVVQQHQQQQVQQQQVQQQVQQQQQQVQVQVQTQLASQASGSLLSVGQSSSGQVQVQGGGAPALVANQGSAPSIVYTVSAAQSVRPAPVPNLAALKPLQASATTATPSTTVAVAAASASTPSSSSSASALAPAAGGAAKSATPHDEELNDVTALCGMNLNSESETSMSAPSSAPRQCPEHSFLQPALLRRRLLDAARSRGLPDVSEAAVSLLSAAAERRITDLLERAAAVADHRCEPLAAACPYLDVSNDARRRLKFLAELDAQEKQRKDEAERERLLRAAKSRAKMDDPEQQKLKQKARELQEAEYEQHKQDKANETAARAIFGSSRKRPLFSSHLGAASSLSQPPGQAKRPRTTRVGSRDLAFVVERDARVPRKFLYKAVT